jgi:myo-inositol-1(or 4)-monophosphatase
MEPLAFAVDVAREAGALQLARLGSPLDVREKGSRGDLVTAVDRECERMIVERIRRAFPRSAILAEEGGDSAGAGDGRWLVDPLDGTTNYAHGYPLFCVSLAYERDGAVVAGVVYAPAIGELYAAERSRGATCNGERLAVSRIPRVADAMVCTGFNPAHYERNGPQFAALSRRAQAVRRDGSAALDLCFVACGRFDAFWEFGLHPWDVAAGALIVREAGGTVSAASGGDFVLDGRSVLASNGRVHAEMTEALAAAGS